MDVCSEVLLKGCVLLPGCSVLHHERRADSPLGNGIRAFDLDKPIVFFLQKGVEVIE